VTCRVIPEEKGKKIKMILTIPSKNLGNSLGLISMCDIEKIPYVVEEKLTSQPHRLYVFINYQDEIPDAILQDRPVLILGKTSARILEQYFGCDNVSCEIEQVVLAEDEQVMVFPEVDVMNIAGNCPENLAGVAQCGTMKIFRKKDITYCNWDFTAAFFSLVNEHYFEYRPDLLTKLINSGTIQKMYYYLLTKGLRKMVQIRAMAGLEKRIAERPLKTEYPFDGRGIYLINLLKRLLLAAAGEVVTIAKWPAPYNSAACFQHDIEPTKYAYSYGMRNLLTNRLNIAKNSLGLVAGNMHIYDDEWILARLKNIVVLSHGLNHDGRILFSSYAEIKRRLHRSQEILENKLGKPINGFRSPRLDRNQNLVRVLDESAYKYDLSFPDVDRENSGMYGGGVCLNLPFRMYRGEKACNFLSLPATTPDCIMPLYSGIRVEQMLQDYDRKIATVAQNNGMMIFSVHAGAFSEDDMFQKNELYNYLQKKVAKMEDVWLTNVEKIYGWWNEREQLVFSYRDDKLVLQNNASRHLRKLRVCRTTARATREVAVDKINSGESVVVE